MDKGGVTRQAGRNWLQELLQVRGGRMASQLGHVGHMLALCSSASGNSRAPTNTCPRSYSTPIGCYSNSWTWDWLVVLHMTKNSLQNAQEPQLLFSKLSERNTVLTRMLIFEILEWREDRAEQAGFRRLGLKAFETRLASVNVVMPNFIHIDHTTTPCLPWYGKHKSLIFCWKVCRQQKGARNTRHRPNTTLTEYYEAKMPHSKLATSPTRGDLLLSTT